LVIQIWEILVQDLKIQDKNKIMKTFKQFNEGLKNRSAVKLAGELGAGLGLVLQTVRGIAQGKHKKRRIFKKDIKQQKSNTSVQDIGL